MCQRMLLCGKQIPLKQILLTITTGGDAVNEAIVLSRLGNKSSVVVRLDNRNIGDMIYRDLQDENVDVSLVARKDDCENFTSMIFIHPDGDHDFIVGPGKDYTLSRSDVDFSAFTQTERYPQPVCLH